MRKIIPILMLPAGLWLLLYPVFSQQRNAALQHRAVAAWEAAEGDTDILGYLNIPKLSLTLPIRQGTSAATLQSGIGLLEGTGFDAHAVLCGHSGLPEATLFTDLHQLQPGDQFAVTLRDRVRSYEVVQVIIAEPEESHHLQPEVDRELCTLLTCTPYGINSHRLLIRGTLLPVSP